LTPDNKLTITALVEVPQATLGASPPLNEVDLNDQTVTIDLTQETFSDPGSLVPGDFTLNNAPGGLSIAGIVGTPTSTHVELDLAFTPGDFDVDSTNFSITIAQSVLIQSVADLTTNVITITSLVESAAIDDPGLNEVALDGQSVTITLTDETFADLTLSTGNIALNNAPTGLSIESITSVTTTSAVVNLAFTPGDFDTDSTRFSISISPSELTQTSDLALTSNEITISAAIETASINDPSLNEAVLDGQSVTITLANETFADLTLSTGNINLNNIPAGLTIESITDITTTTAVVNLAFTPGDFDGSYPNFSISIDPSELTQTSDLALTTNTITITALIESATMTGPGLNETALDGQSVTITLTNETFDDPLEAINFALGGTIGVNYPAVVDLAFDGTDFDANFTDFYITIAAADLVQTSADVLTPSNRLTITALMEVPQATLSADSILEERRLDARILTIDFFQETFSDPGSLVPGDFTLNNAPGGLSIAGIVGTPTSTHVELDLAFTPGDFDMDSTNFSITIAQSVLIQSVEDLTTNNLPVIANIETATLAPDTLIENTLNGSTLTITLGNENFSTTGTVDPINFNLENGPAGFTIASATVTSPTQVVLTMQFNGPEFDIDVPNVRIGIDPGILRYTSSEPLFTNTITIQAYIENPEADLTADAVLHEYNLDTRELYIDLVEETFSNPGTLITDNFTLMNAPPGLDRVSVIGTSNTGATLVLQFDGTDFDVDYPDFYVLIDASVLVQSTADLATSALNIASGLEPIITNVSIPNETMKIDDMVTVTITVEDDQGDTTFSLDPGAVIGGYPLTGLTRVNNTTYTCTFTVEEGGITYAADEYIHVQIRMWSDGVPGNIYLDPIVQDNDLLDASRPVIQFIYTTDGTRDIGSEIFLWIQTDGSNYTFTPTSLVNNVPFSSPSIEITYSGSNRYRLRYVVSEGDHDVNQGELTLNVQAVDLAGNVSVPFTTVDAMNLSIDASRPMITQAFISSDDDNIIVGETLEITVVADQPGYRNNPNTWINNIPVGPQVTFEDLGNNRYQYRYTVHEDDGSVESGNLAINIVLQDREPYDNVSTAFTSLDANNVSIETDKPSATISGSDSICPGGSALVTVILGGTAPWVIFLTELPHSSGPAHH
jgi:exosome complex RNA-binding protein Rrp42 (RNase PH superfamily)